MRRLESLQRVREGIKMAYELTKIKNQKLRDVVTYTINYSNYKHGSISGMRLHPLLYLIQSGCIYQNERLLFEDRFINMDFGLVIPDVYDEFWGYGSNSLPTLKNISQELTMEEQELIRITIDELSDCTTHQLSEMVRGMLPYQQTINKGFGYTIDYDLFFKELEEWE